MSKLKGTGFRMFRKRGMRELDQAKVSCDLTTILEVRLVMYVVVRNDVLCL